MEVWELSIPTKPVRKKNGRFPKGHVPFNKGKKWSVWMDGRKQRKVRKNLVIGRKMNTHTGGWNRKAVVGISIDGKTCFFSSSKDAAMKLGLIDRNIRKCCEGKRNTVGGVFFYWVDEWNGDTTITDEQRRRYEIMEKQQKTRKTNSKQ